MRTETNRRPVQGEFALELSTHSHAFWTPPELLEPRLYLSGTLGGTVFSDLDGNGVQDANESGLAGWAVYIDDNLNGVLDAPERSVTTDSEGDYQFSDIETGFHDVAVVAESDLRSSGNRGVQTISLTAGHPDAAGVDFGFRTQSEFSVQSKDDFSREVTLDLTTLGVRKSEGWQIDWGDGQNEKVAAGVESVTHQYTLEGAYEITTQVLDGTDAHPLKPITVNVGRSILAQIPFRSLSGFYPYEDPDFRGLPFSKQPTLQEQIELGTDLFGEEFLTLLSLGDYASNLVGHWQFDESSGSVASDASGSGNDGAVSGAVFTTGYDGNGLSFDGTDDGVVVPHSFNLELTRNFTLSIWIKPDDVGTDASPGNRQTLIGKAFNASEKQFILDINPTGGLEFETQYNGNPIEEAVSADDLVQEGVWQHVAVTFDDDLHATIYLNGVAVVQQQMTFEPRNREDDLTIGFRGGSYNDFYYNGIIDDVRLYNATLTDFEIAELADLTAPFVRVTAPDAQADEEGQDSGTFLIERSDASGALTVYYSLGGSADSGDYEETLSGSVVIPDGMESVSLTVTPDDDLDAEGVEDLTLTLTADAAYRIVGTVATIEITDDEITSPVAHWKLDETSGTSAADASGNGNNGSVSGGATWTTGHDDNAINLDGSNDYISIANDSAFNLTKNFTLAAWIYPDSVSGYREILAKASGASEKQYILELDAGVLKFEYERNNNNWTTSGGSVSTGDWYHVAVTIDQDLNYALYLDGEVVASGTAPAEVLASTAALNIGRRAYTGDRFFDGLIDDVRIYDQALTSVQIAQLAEASGEIVEVVALDADAAEQGQDTARFRIRRSGSSGNLTVYYSVSGDSSAGDYGEALSGSIVIPDGATSVVLDVTPVDDQLPEGAESLTLTLTADASYTIAQGSATITIADNEPGIRAVADAYVRNGSYDDNNFGHEDQLYVKYSSTALYEREVYLRFDVSALGDSTAAILQLHPIEVGTEAADTQLNFHVVTGEWTESTIRYEDRPDDTVTLIDSITGISADTHLQLDITSQVQNAIANTDGILVIRITAEDEGSGGRWVAFASREYANESWHPTIIATRQAPQLTIDAPSSFTVDQQFTITLNASDPADANTEWAIDWGDGSTSTATGNVDVEVLHTYTSEGDYTIRALAKGFEDRRLPGETRYHEAVANLEPIAYWRLGNLAKTNSVVDSAGILDGVHVWDDEWPVDNHPDLPAQRHQSGWLFDSEEDRAVEFIPGHIQVGHDSSLELNSGSISFFMRDLTVIKDTYLVDKNESGYGAGGDLSIKTVPDTGTEDDTGSLLIRLEDTSTTYELSAAIEAGQWYHVAFTWGTGGMKLYINGEMEDSDSYTGGLGANLHDLILGAYKEDGWSDATNRFSGLLDEVALFDTALTDQQIRDLYWTESVSHTFGDDSLILVESDRFVTTNETVDQEPWFITIPTEDANTLSINYSGLVFDDTSDSERRVNDAFELALLDEDGQSVVPTIGSGRDAFFNITETAGSSLAEGVLLENETATSGTVAIDVSHLAGQTVSLVVRLINNDFNDTITDQATTVTIDREVTFDENGIIPDPFQATPARLPAPGHDVDFDRLIDVTGSFDIDYQQTAFNDATNVMSVVLSLTSNGAFTLRDRLLLAVRGIDKPFVSLFRPHGVTPDGMPYIDLSTLAFADAADRLIATDTVEGIVLSLFNPQRTGFDYELVLLGQVNEAPAFTTLPLEEVHKDNPNGYVSDAIAEDPDGDAVTYSLISGPTGMTIDIDKGRIEWDASDVPDSVENHSVVVRAEDGEGAFKDHAYVLKVVDLPNRPPRFETDPVTEAYAGVEYTYDADATDPDGDTLTYSDAGDITDGLVAHWRFDETAGAIAADSAGSYDATLMGDAAFAPSGRGSGAVAFDGDGDYVVTQESVLDPATTDFTASAWVKFDSLPTGSDVAVIMAQQNGSGTGRAWLVVNTSGNNHTFYSLLGGSGVLNSGVSATVDEWRHVAVSYDGATLRLYVDGALRASNNRSMEAADGDMVFGINKGLSVFELDGAIDDARIFDRALSDEEIERLSNQTPIAGLDVDSATGVVTWTPTPDLVGQVVPVTLQVTDGNGGRDEQPYRIRVIDLEHRGEIRGIKWYDRDENGIYDASGRILIGHDVNTLTTQAVNELGENVEEVRFAINIARWLVRGNSGNILAVVPNSDDTRAYADTVVDALDAHGFDVTYITDTDLTGTDYDELSELLPYDAIFAGETFTAGNVIDNDVLIDYVESGGNVYLFGGVGAPGSLTDAIQLDTFLEHFGFEFSLAHITPNLTTVSIDSNHEVFEGIEELWAGLGNAIYDLEPNNPRNQIIASHNGDGLYAIYEAEERLQNWLIYIDKNNNGTRDPGERFTYTDENGEYIFDGLPADTYVIREQQQSGWMQTTPPNGYYSVALERNEVVTNIDFGNAAEDVGEIHGVKWHDLNANGTRDVLVSGTIDNYFDDFAINTVITDQYADEGLHVAMLGGAAGPFISAFDTGLYPSVSGLALKPATTAAEFFDFEFTFDAPIDYFSLLAVDGEEAFEARAYSNGVLVDSFSHGATTGNVTVLVELGGISGSTIFDQVVIDLVEGFDPSPNFPAGPELYTELSYNLVDPILEPGLSDWIIYIDGNDDVILNPGERWTATNENGEYAFDGLPEGDYIIREVQQSGWQQTAPTNGYYEVELTDDEVVNGIDFGNTEYVPTTNAKPVFENNPDETVRAEFEFRYDPIVTDADHDDVTVRLASGPEGMAIDPLTGTLHWRPRASQVDTHLVVLQADDGRGGIRTKIFALDVLANGAPIFDPQQLPPTSFDTNGVETDYEHTIVVTDPEDDPVTVTLLEGPEGMTYDDQTGLLSFPAPAVGVYRVSLLAQDILGAQTIHAYTLQVFDSSQNNPPVIDTAYRSEIQLGQTFVHRVTATDPDGDTVTFSVVGTPPTGVTFNDPNDSEPNLIIWTPPPGDTGMSITIEADDGRGGTDEHEFVVTVVDTAANGFPQIAEHLFPTATVGVLYREQLEASDPDGDPLFWVLADGPDNASIDRVTGELTWLPTLDQVGVEHRFEVHAVDPFGKFGGVEVFIPVRAVNTAPKRVSDPLTRAIPNETYETEILFTDLEGDPLSVTMVDQPAWLTSATFNSQTNTLTLSGTPTVEDTYPVTYTVDDGDYFVTHTFDIVVENPNQPPEFGALPAMFASVGQAFSYQVNASDPEDGASVNYALINNPPTNMSIDGSGQITWGAMDVDDAYNDTYVFVQVTDNNDPAAQSIARIPLYVQNNAAPTIDLPDGTQQVVLGATYRLDLWQYAEDTDSDRLEFELAGDGVNPFPGTAFVEHGRWLVWDTTGQQTQQYVIEVTVTDPFGASASDTLALNLSADTETPAVSIQPAYQPVPIGQEVAIHVSAWDNVRVESMKLLMQVGAGNPVPVPLDLQRVGSTLTGVARITPASSDAITLTAFAYDAADNEGALAEPYSLLLFDPANTDAPVIAWTDQAGDPIDINTAEPVDVTADIDDANLSDMINWTLRIRPADGNAWTILDSGSFEQTAQYVEQITATIDPTLLANGSHVLELRASDGAHVTTARRTVNIDTNAKVGNFALSFTDLSVHVGGVPITITRSYDSLDAGRDGDFGYGWSMNYRDAKIKVTATSTAGAGFGDLPAYTDDTLVWITLPGGKQEVFRFSPQPTGFGSNQYVPLFTPLPGTYSTLEVAGVYLLKDTSSGTYVLPNDGILDNYNPAAIGGAFALTTPDGTRFEINAADGFIGYITDRLGNELDFTNPARITARDAQGNVTAVVQIERNDANNRITAITDPAGKSIEYTYNALGDLVSVTNRTDEETTFVYNVDENGDPIGRPHFLTRIVDNAGVRVLQATFDEDGRLEGLKDASGATAPFVYTIDGESAFGLPAGFTVEQVSDADGVPIEIVRDERGNVVVQVQRIEETGNAATRPYLVTTYRYDANDNQTHVSFAYEHVGDAGRFTDAWAIVSDPEDENFNQSDWQSITTYDDLGNVLSSTDALGNTTRYAYDNFGSPRRIIDPLGNVTANTFNPATGLLEKTTQTFRDADGVQRTTITEYEYDASGAGNLAELKQTRDDGSSFVVASFEYDGKGRLISSTSVDPDAGGSQQGVTRHFVYDDAGNQTLSYQHWTNPNDPQDKKTLVSRTEYDAEGRVTGSRQYTIDGEQTYSAASQLDTETPDWSTATTYTSTGQVESSTDQFGTVTTNTYDARGLLIETKTEAEDAEGDPTFVVTRSVYDANGRLIFQTDAFDVNNASGGDTRGTQMVYDALGRVIEMRRIEHLEVDLVTDTIYPSLFISEVSNLGSLTILSVNKTRYDEHGRVHETENAEGLVTRYGYDDAGRQTTVTIDPEGNFGLLAVTTYAYDAAGRQTSATDALGRVTEFIYDALGRVTHTRQVGDPGTIADDVVVKTIYNALGHRIAEIDPMGRRTDYAYDDAGRLTSVTFPGVFDGDPLSATFEDIVRPVYTYEYDDFSNHTAILDPRGNRAEFRFDELGRQLNRVLPLGVETTGDPDDFTEHAIYNALGQVTRAIDFEGRVTDYAYDGFGRLATKRYAVDVADADLETYERTVEYTYDAFGRVVEIDDDAHGTTTHTYDAEGRLTRIVSPEGAMNYEYDALGRLTRTYTGSADVAHTSTASDGKAVTDTRYGYDELGRLTNVAVYEREDTPLTTPEETTYSYDLVGNLDEQVNEWNDVVADYQYDALNRLEQLTHFVDEDDDRILDEMDEEVRAKFVYEYQLDGARTQVIETDDFGDVTTITWTYDGLGRLISETSDSDNNDRDYVDVFEYDLASNRQAYTRTGTTSGGGDFTTTYEYDANDRLLNEEGPDGYIVYDYDNTQQTSKTTWTDDSETSKLSETTYHYDAAGRMVEVEIDSDGDGNVDVTQTYVYSDDASGGLRVREVTDDGSTLTARIYHYDPRNHTGYAKPVEEYVDTGSGATLDRTYTLGHDIIAQYDATNNTITFAKDGHGSTRILLDDAAAVLQRFAYNAVGETIEGANLTSAAASLTAWLAVDGRYNPTTHLTYHLVRDRDGWRFITSDPYVGNIDDPLSLHKYLYAHANPVMGIDPTGLRTLVELNVAVFIGAIIASLQATNTANAPGPNDFTYADTGGDLFFDFAFELLTLGAWRLVGNPLRPTLHSATPSPRRLSPTVSVLPRAGGAASPWTLAKGLRSDAIELLLAKNTPRTFRTIDRFTDGVATSIKTIDLNATTHLSNPRGFVSTFRGHIDEVAEFQGGQLGTFRIRNSDIVRKELEIAIPPNSGTQTQGNAFAEIIAYGQERGIQVKIVIVE